MNSVQNNKSSDVFIQLYNFYIHYLLSFIFRQDVISILCCACAQASSTQETCFVHLLIISSFSCVFPLPSITMATSRKVLRRVWVYCKEGKKRKKSNIFLQQMFTCDFWLYEGSPSSQSMESLSSPWKKLTDNLPTSRRQPHLTTYQLPCNADTVWGAASSRLTWEA